MKLLNARIGFVATRLAGTDGVSLEVEKWVKVLEGMGHTCCFFAGESTWPAERSMVVPDAHFTDPAVLQITHDLFDNRVRAATTSQHVDAIKQRLKWSLYQFQTRFNPDILIVENALTIPMHVPLGLAITEFVAENSIPTIAHHHDFYWERTRYALNAAEDYLNAAFPPTLHAVAHVVINSFAQEQLARRCGVSSMIVPNVMDFAESPLPSDGIAAAVRNRLQIAADEYLLLQPTRIVPRKRIERAVELAKKLDLPCTLVISHEAGDEGVDYRAYLEWLIDLLDVKVRFAADCFGMARVVEGDRIQRFSLSDAYLAADLVTYPSAIEGFGNAFLEAIYYRRPLVVSAYDIFRLDIEPKGFQVVKFDEFITATTVRQAHALLLNPELSAEMAEHNFQLGQQHYSFANLERALAALMTQCLGM